MSKIEKKNHQTWQKVSFGQEHQRSTMDYHHEGPGDKREGRQGGALHVGGGNHKIAKNRRKKYQTWQKVSLGQEHQRSTMDYHHEGPRVQPQRGHEGALLVGGGDHKIAKK